MNNTSNEWYLKAGEGFGAFSGIITFIGAYIYCVASYGFLLGFGLGWLPSFMLAAIVGVTIRYLWGVIVLGIGVIIILAASSFFWKG